MRDLNDLGRDAEVIGHEAAIDRAVPLPLACTPIASRSLPEPGRATAAPSPGWPPAILLCTTAEQQYHHRHRAPQLAD